MVIAYIRVSTDDQSNSIDAQTAAVRRYCQFKNIILDQIFTDEDISGFTPLADRPAGSRLQTMVSAGAVTTIIAVKPDRLFRNTVDALITVSNWNDLNLDLHIIDMGGASFSTKTAIGKLMFTTIVSVAEFERNITSERTKSVLAHKRDTNKVYCREIFGYDNVNGSFIENPEEMKIIHQILKMNKDGSGPTQIASTLNAEGKKTKTGKAFFQSTVSSILNKKSQYPQP